MYITKISHLQSKEHDKIIPFDKLVWVHILLAFIYLFLFLAFRMTKESRKKSETNPFSLL